ncbi:hypothetical protein FB45DRAFT_886142 [Roridomyces roridus]|uniref:F-box domain-containing protein n=1 Tax=Roridomyces roridus TaxID=1738132 RepID=A0AAD7G1Y5_9AGAR|nr:hypothetical protein FB45DRAFT_886142 [Roridomyces roridus]
MPQAPLTCLQKLHIRGAYDDAPCSWIPILELLRLSPNLADLRIQNTSFVDADDVDENVVLPNLRRLKCTGGFLEGSSLRWLSAPGLETLTLSPSIFPNTEPGAIISFLRRSSPPLRELVVSYGYIGEQDFTWFALCTTMSLLDTVSHLELNSAMPHILDRLFTILERPPSNALPALHTLILRNVEPEISPGPSWNGLARALTSRLGKLRTVRVILADDEWTLPQEVRSLFAEFLEDGMDIYIGTEGFGGTNLLAAN